MAEGFVHSMQACQKRIEQAHDSRLQELARSLMPLASLQEDAKVQVELNSAPDPEPGTTPPLQPEDYLAMGLVAWFKRDLFKWVDSPPCCFCGSEPTKGMGQTAPSAEESRHQASRTELYACAVCDQITRFPRYNSVEKLLETRAGRCGEWANAFLLFCCAAGLHARYIWDSTDHVWTEYWSHSMGRWVHLDSCEAAHDKPLLYEQGWGKQLQYVMGVDKGGVTDVTPRYTRNWMQVLQRRSLVPESRLQGLLLSLSRGWRARMPKSSLPATLAKDMAELLELFQCKAAKGAGGNELEGLGGRTTGSQAWREARGETGLQAPKAIQSTPWYPVQLTASGRGSSAIDWQLALTGTGRICEGACRASGENGRGEGCLNLFDSSTSSKWLDFGGGGHSGQAWVEFKLRGQPASAGLGLVLTHYDLVSANDSSERDPGAWVLEGLTASSLAPCTHDSKSDNGSAPTALTPTSTWVVLDERKDEKFMKRQELRSFTVTQPEGASGPPSCIAWRLRITKSHNPASANSVQLACWNLYSISKSEEHREQGNVAAGEAAQASGGGASEPGETQRGSADVVNAVRGVVGQVQSAKLDARDLEVVKLMLEKVKQNPLEEKYRRVRAQKLPTGLYTCTAALHLLSVSSWRLIWSSGGTDGGLGAQDWSWTLPAGDEVLAQVNNVLTYLSSEIPKKS